MIIRTKLPRGKKLHEPLLHPDHPKPVTRRQLLAAGLLGSQACVLVPSALLGLLAKPRTARASLDADIQALVGSCGITPGAGKIPFIVFDLAGGANLTGSETLIGGAGGQLDFLSTAGYGKLGLPGNMLPNSPNPGSASGNFIDSSLGLAWHSDGGMLRGIKSKASTTAQSGTNGVAIAAVSQTDTSTNPHNPMYGIWMAGANGQLLTLIGTQATTSGGNSMAPAALIDLSETPSVVRRSTDVTGLVDTGQLGTMFPGDPQASVSVLESTARLSGGTDLSNFTGKLGASQVFPGNAPSDTSLKTQMLCGNAKSADLVNTFGNPAALNPDLDTNIVGAGNSIFTATDYQDSDIKATAAVMKMVISGFAGAGTVTLGGYDYHDSTRATGETKNFHAGVCIGACLEYAMRMNKPVMIYVISDGSLVSTGMADNSAAGRGKYGWQGDSSTSANTFFLVFNPAARPQLIQGGPGNQIGHYNTDGSVNTSSSPAANAVNLLVQTVILNYMALHGEAGNYPTVFSPANASNFPSLAGTSPGLGLGTSASQLDPLIAFQPIVNHVIP
ncbi:MAG TPA: hypothetical protein VEV18_08380 [Steroidobacteraceae bacterium]|nr:hypothetical protein [Steroidobacteraceae bacterium]